MSTTGYGYAVVQHSGYGYRGHPEWQRGLETRRVPSRAVADKVTGLGGVIKPYTEAEDWAQAEMYPPHTGMIPAAPGSFSDYQVDGLALYLPLPKKN